MKTKFVVSVEIPNGVTKNYMAEYIREAVACWSGGMDPEDPIFDLKGKTVTVRPQKPAFRSAKVYRTNYAYDALVLDTGIKDSDNTDNETIQLEIKVPRNTGERYARKYFGLVAEVFDYSAPPMKFSNNVIDQPPEKPNANRRTKSRQQKRS